MAELVKHPKDYYGRQVLVDGAVEDVYSRTVFAIDDDRVLTTGRGVIVVAPTLRRPIVDRSDVTVVGDLIKFDKGDIEDRFKDYDLDLPSAHGEHAARDGRIAAVGTLPEAVSEHRARRAAALIVGRCEQTAARGMQTESELALAWIAQPKPWQAPLQVQPARPP